MHERRAIETLCRRHELPIAWPELAARAASQWRPSPQREAWVLAGLAQSAGASPEMLQQLPDAELQRLRDEVDALPRLRRRQLFHEAYERRYRRQILDGMAALRPHMTPRLSGRADAQYVFCIDEREESLRRALEEFGPSIETFGVAGFFGVAIDYSGLYDDAPAAHCPVVVTPAHEIHESPIES